MDLAAVQSRLITDEGLRLKPYLDTAGKTTLGVGRNLSDVGITHEEALYLLNNDIKTVCDQLDHYEPWWRKLDDVRQRALISMCFNLGIGRLLEFKNALTAIRLADWPRAHDEMLNSSWASQVPNRVKTLAAMMLTGKDA